MKLFRNLLLSLAILLALASLWAALSGNSHLFFGLRNTYLKGRTGPTIDERDIYANRMVQAGVFHPWPDAYVNRRLPAEDMAFLAEQHSASLLVLQADSIRFEYYDAAHGPEVPSNIWSMAKSIMSVLVGIAQDDGLLSEEDLLEQYDPRYSGSGIRLKHLLTMSSGIDFDESYSNPLGHQAKALYGNDLVALNEKYGPADPPGVQFNYLGGNTILLGMILRKVSGMELSEYASQKLWSRIGVEHAAQWSLDREGGMEKVFCCFHITPRDMARFGQMVLHGGVWNGDTIVSKDYLDRATTAASFLREADGSMNERYGYHWWVLNLPDYQGFYARGLDGQFMVILPNEDLIVIRTGDRESTDRKKGHVSDMLRYVDMGRALLR